MGYGAEWEANLVWVVEEGFDTGGCTLAAFVTFVIEHWEYLADKEDD